MRLHYPLLLGLTLVAGCSKNSPGPLEGTWRIGGLGTYEIVFRDGETQTANFVEKVSYEMDGRDVLMTYLDGPSKGSTVRFKFTDADHARSSIGSLSKVRK